MSKSCFFFQAEQQKVFIQRDFSQGTAVKFQTLLPPELDIMIEPEQFSNSISQLNEIFNEAESISTKVVTENLIGCLTAYLVFLCIPTHYEKCLRRISKKIVELNKQVFVPRGLLLIDPAERGLRVIEVCIIRSPPTVANSVTHNSNSTSVAANGQIKQPLLGSAITIAPKPLPDNISHAAC